MENKTAVEWLIGRFHYEGFIGNFCSEELIKSKREIMIEIIEKAKEMEKEQIKDAHLIGLITSMEMEATKQAEQYYQETYKK